MNIEIITAVAIGIGLSASAGFRVFIPMLVASIAAHFNLLPANEGFEWLGSNASLITFLVATIVEVLAYYMPIVDNLLDSLTTPLAVGAGTLLMTSVLPVDSELLRWVTGFIVGGGAAATMQGSTALARLTSTKLTATVGNPILSTTENVAALGTSVLTLLLPIFMSLLFITFAFFIFRKTINKRMQKK